MICRVQAAVVYCTYKIENARNMKKKLTLVLDSEVIARAKRMARSNGESLSDVVERYLTEQTQTESWVPEAGSVMDKLTGAIQADQSGMDDKDRLYQAIREKHG